MQLAAPEDTLALGRAIAASLVPGDIVALTGDLGAGKSVLARGILSGLGHHGDVPSPTFALVIPYEPPATLMFAAHCDLYRLDGPKDVRELGLEDMLIEGVLIVEWPDRLPEFWLEQALGLSLQVRPDGARDLTAHTPPSWEARWPLT